ncbi:monocarboxylate transporter 9-like [Sitophilus oryzae]|uniref:Monocarboxylate transporter 9-like n=1 Tax=Sitophilus oryzae TaxID=7048 RepID=A0A6J2YSZ0_SITOR|nr:monocarboxylate transporter 9-like [Sitophilus oryzae]XP_030766428.1 monocarboxylate transporter 9-like [Sitophilus oryzae]XP_030766429.1 monocarboxylate transporter 9-like [Sitophilus oryzae]
MDKSGEKKSETYYPDGGYGWIIVCAIILINVSLLTLVPCFGIIFRDEFKEWGITAAQTSFLLHLQSSLYCCFGFFTSPFLKMYGMRKVAFFGAFLMSLGIFLTSFGTSYFFLIFSVSVLTGMGQGTLMPATYLATYTYFKKRLTVATSLSVTGASMAPIFMPKICDILLTKFGRRFTVLFLFFVSLLSLIGCFLLKPVKQKSSEENENDIKLNSEVEVKEELLKTIENGVYEKTTIEKPMNVWKKLLHTFDLHLLQDVPFVLIVLGLGVSFASELNIILMLQFILQELSQFERSEAAVAISVMSITDILGRLVVPMVAHMFNAPPKLMYGGALVVASIGRTVLAGWSKEVILVFISIGLIGLTKGCRAVFQSVIIPKFVALEKIPGANGINMLFTGGISLVIGPIIGVIHDKTGSYFYALHASTVLSLLCVTLWIVELIYEKRRYRSAKV